MSDLSANNHLSRNSVPAGPQELVTMVAQQEVDFPFDPKGGSRSEVPPLDNTPSVSVEEGEDTGSTAEVHGTLEVL